MGRGFVAQTCLAMEASSGRLLSLSNLALTMRPEASNHERDETRTQRMKRRNEADVWFETLTHIGTPPAGAVWISVGDRDSDCFRYFRQARDAGWHVLARLCHDRLIVEFDDASGTVRHLLPHLRGLAPAVKRHQEWAPWRHEERVPGFRPASLPLAIHGEQRLLRGGLGQAPSRLRRRPAGPGLREPDPQEIIQPGCWRRWSAGLGKGCRRSHAELCASVANGVGLIRPERRFSRSR